MLSVKLLVLSNLKKQKKIDSLFMFMKVRISGTHSSSDALQGKDNFNWAHKWWQRSRLTRDNYIIFKNFLTNYLFTDCSLLFEVFLSNFKPSSSYVNISIHCLIITTKFVGLLLTNCEVSLRQTLQKLNILISLIKKIWW